MSVPARDAEDRLLCPDCGRPIGGATGLDEALNIIAHRSEHHEEQLDLSDALQLRIVWETAS